MEWSLRTGIVLTPDRRSYSAVARIEPITRATRSAPVDPARGTDLHERSQVLPDARRVPLSDVVKFQEFLFGTGSEGVSLASPVGMTSPVAASNGALLAARGPDVAPIAAPVAAPKAASVGEAPPADRIAATLAHLRQLRGL